MHTTRQTAAASAIATITIAMLAVAPCARADDCRTEFQIYAELETFGYREIQFHGEKAGRLMATASDEQGTVSEIILDTCSGEVSQVKKKAP